MTGTGRRVEGKQSVTVFDFARLYPNLNTTLGSAEAGWRKGSRTEDRSILPKTNRVSVCNPIHLVRGNMKGMLSVCVVLYAGLHPFHIPANQVNWVADADAVRFGEYGTILSSGSFPPPGFGGAERSIEIWVQPGKVKDSNTLLAFYSPASPRQLSLLQSVSDLEIRIQSSVAWRSVKTERTYIDDAFRDGKSAFWTVTSGRSGTTVYRDGELVGDPLSALRRRVQRPPCNRQFADFLR